MCSNTSVLTLKETVLESKEILMAEHRAMLILYPPRKTRFRMNSDSIIANISWQKSSQTHVSTTDFQEYCIVPYSPY